MSDIDDKVVPFRRHAKPTSSLMFPDITATGAVKATCANTRVAIGEMGVVCRYDRFHDKLLISGAAIEQYTGELTDYACLYLRELIDLRFGFDPKREAIRDACIQLCLNNEFDPIVAYLHALEWDGIDRIGEWLTTYLGAKDTELNRAIGKIALIAQVRRARDPGCKFDQIIVLEGPEGINKSSALLALAGGPENFSDQTILGQHDREQQEALRGVWVYEIADLSNIRRAEVEDVKAFASRTHDRARPAYGAFRVDLPRRSIIWATTNNSEYLKSQTGNRRFWPIEVGVIHPVDLDSLVRDRDQLFAEACQLEAESASIVLPRKLWAAASKEQEQRREADPWEDILRLVKGAVCDAGDFKVEERILSQQLLSEQIGIPKERQKNQDLKRLGEAMRNLGWAGPKVFRVGEKLGRGYWRPVT